MPIIYQKKIAVLQDNVSIEEAEGLLEWLIKYPKNRLNLANCNHLHTANLQVMMAVKPAISAWPKNTNLRAWLESALKNT